MPDPEEARELVRQDVEIGFGSWLRSDADVDRAGFRILEPFDAETEPIMNHESGTVVIPWAWVGRHEAVESDDDGGPHPPADAMGYLPTGRVVEVRGVTLVRDTEDGPAFSRFVDWVSALADIGVVVSPRPVTDEVPPSIDLSDPEG
jgi:hypothetical protein